MTQKSWSTNLQTGVLYVLTCIHPRRMRKMVSSLSVCLSVCPGSRNFIPGLCKKLSSFLSSARYFLAMQLVDFALSREINNQAITSCCKQNLLVTERMPQFGHEITREGLFKIPRRSSNYTWNKTPEAISKSKNRVRRPKLPYILIVHIAVFYTLCSTLHTAVAPR